MENKGGGGHRIKRSYKAKISIIFVALLLLFLNTMPVYADSTCTWNPNDKGNNVTLVNNNLTAILSSTSGFVRANQGVSSGKWYWEVTVNEYDSIMIGVVPSSVSNSTTLYTAGTERLYYDTGKKISGNNGQAFYGSSIRNGSVIGVALDMDTGTITFYNNGVSQGVAFTDLNTLGVVYPVVGNGNTTSEVSSTSNFGPTSFKHSIPSGYQPLTSTLLLPSPKGLQDSNITTNSLDLSWQVSSGATSYVIFQNGNQIETTTGTTYHISNLNPNTTYSFQIAAVNNAGQSPLSNTVNATTLGVPPIGPTGLSVGNITNTSFTLYWIKQSDAVSYNVYMDGTLAGNVLQPPIYNPSFDVSNLTNGSTHSMTVTAVNQWGESTASQPLTVTLVPGPPTLQASNITTSSLDLSWSVSSGATSYVIFQNGNQIETTTGTSYPVINLTPNTTYGFQIAAINNAGQSPLSNTVNATTQGVPPIGPTGLSAGNITSTSFTLYWIKQSDASSYNVYLDGTLVGNVSQPLLYNPSFDISNLPNGSTHTMTITAVNQWGESTASQPLSVTLFPSPTGLQDSNITTNSLDLSWSTASGATSYVIFQNSNQISTTTGTAYHVNNLNPSTAYSFQIVAVNGAGQSPLSNTVNATTLGIPPIAPTGLSAGNITQTSFALYWIKQPDATSYNVYLDGTIAGNVLQPLLFNPSFNVSNLANGSTHTMTVTAVNQWGTSATSQPLIVTATIPDPVLKAIVDNSNINLTWNGLGNSFNIMVNGTQIDQISSSPYSLTEKPGTYQIQIIQNYNGQQYPSNALPVTISALQNVGSVQMTSDLLSNTGIVIAPVGGLLALALALKGSPLLIAAAKAFFLKR
ncbi:MAG: fibronectin type III domain-containing protein [Desulfosporosinus sp.]|nr:fibronectin type III domain-containing protein [Desulfosporosinus sp.]